MKKTNGLQKGRLLAVNFFLHSVGEQTHDQPPWKCFHKSPRKPIAFANNDD